MGNTVTTTAAPVYDLHSLVSSELPTYLIASQVSKSKFLKTLMCVHERRSGDSGAAPHQPGAKEKSIVKVFLRRGDKSADMSARLQAARSQLAAICRAISLGAQPNLLPYQWFEESSRSDVAYLARQHVQYSLLERLSSRPFLSRGDKLWLVYQLLRALEQAHGADLRHGDIKTENCLVTSWGWLLLADWAGPLKPTLIPEDHPSDFYYFFEASGRKRCYIAPERFVRERELRLGGGAAQASTPGGATAASTPTVLALAQAGASAGGAAAPSAAAAWGGLTEAMDVFAAGCVVAEVLLDGDVLFDLTSLLRYRADAEVDPFTQSEVAAALADFDASAVGASGRWRDVVKSMCSRDPRARPSAAALLARVAPPPSSSAGSGGGGGEGDASKPSQPLPPPLFPSYFPFIFRFQAALLHPELQASWGETGEWRKPAVLVDWPRSSWFHFFPTFPTPRLLIAVRRCARLRRRCALRRDHPLHRRRRGGPVRRGLLPAQALAGGGAGGGGRGSGAGGCRRSGTVVAAAAAVTAATRRRGGPRAARPLGALWGARDAALRCRCSAGRRARHPADVGVGLGGGRGVGVLRGRHGVGGRPRGGCERRCCTPPVRRSARGRRRAG